MEKNEYEKDKEIISEEYKLGKQYYSKLLEQAKKENEKYK